MKQPHVMTSPCNPAARPLGAASEPARRSHGVSQLVGLALFSVAVTGCSMAPSKPAEPPKPVVSSAPVVPLPEPKPVAQAPVQAVPAAEPTVAAAGGDLIKNPPAFDAQGRPILGTHRCELGRKFTVRQLLDDGRVITVVEGQPTVFRRVNAVSTAIRMESVERRYLWIGVAGKSILMDMRKGQQVANECHPGAPDRADMAMPIHHLMTASSANPATSPATPAAAPAGRSGAANATAAGAALKAPTTRPAVVTGR